LSLAREFENIVQLFFIMKRNKLLKHLKKQGASLLREGRRHTIYQKGQFKSQIPRHNEIVDELARKICKDLGIPFVR
jgi:mRNA interferase HicA